MTTIRQLMVKMGLDGSGFKTGADDIDKSLGGMQDEVDRTSSTFAGLGEAIGTATKLAGAAAGAALVAGMASAVNAEAVNDRLAASLGATPEMAQEFGGIAGRLYANAYGGSLEEVNAALKSVWQNGLIDEDAATADIEAVTATAIDFATAMEMDVGEAARAAGKMVKTGLADNATEAFDILTRGFQQGVNEADDLLDTFSEYGTQFRKLGLDGETAMGLLSQGLQAGARDADVVADAFKEFSIRASDGNAEAAASFQALGLDAQKMTAIFNKGGPEAAAAMQTVFAKLKETQGQADAATIAFGLFGTQSEDLGAALYALDPSSATAALGDVEGAAARLGQTLNDNAQTNLTSFWRQAQTAFVDVVGGQVLPIVNTVASFLATNFGPTLETVSGIVTGTVIPAVTDLARWIGENQTPIMIVAGLIAAVFLPHLIALGVTHTYTAAKAVAAWVVMKANAIASAAVHSAQIIMMIGRWIAMGAAAVVHAGTVVASWALVGAINFVAAIASFAAFMVSMTITAARSVASATMTAAAWVAAQVRTLVSLGVMAAGFVAQGAVMLASVAVTAAGVVAGWVMMGVQSLIQAARMAAAWLIAMGPVGWVIAAVIGLVVLIIAYWDEIVAFTKAAWDKIWGWIKAAADFVWNLFLNWSLPGLIIKYWDEIVAWTKAAWDKIWGSIKEKAQAIADWVRQKIDQAMLAWEMMKEIPGKIAGWFGAAKDWAVGKLSELVDWLGGLPGQILGALGDLGSLLVNAGGDIMSGLWRGIQNAAGWVKDRIMDLVRSIIPGPVADILGIASPSKVMAELGRWVPLGLAEGIDATASVAERAAENLAEGVTAAMAGIVTPGVDVAIPSPRMPTAMTAPTSDLGASPGQERAALYIENYNAAPNSDPQEQAEEWAWLAAGRGGRR